MRNVIQSGAWTKLFSIPVRVSRSSDLAIRLEVEGKIWRMPLLACQP